VVLRNVVKGRTWCLLPVTVLADDPTQTVVRISAGTRWLAATGQDGGRVRMGTRSWRLGHTDWTGHDLTYRITPGAWYAVGALTRPADGELVRWYINCEEPLRRRFWGYDTCDLELDLESDPDGEPQWRWKDVAEYRRLRRQGIVRRRAARRIARGTRQAIEVAARPAVRRDLLDLARRQVPVPDLDRVLGTRWSVPDQRTSGGTR
jgi:hypothetical protein